MGSTDQALRTAGVRYQLVPRTLCFLFHRDRILLLRGAPDRPRWPNLYNGIGGHVERGEDLMSATRREVREETGLEVDQLVLRGTITIDVEPDLGVGVFVFTGEVASGQVRPSAEGQLEWFPTSRLPPSQSMVEDLPLLLTRILNDPHGAAPFFAHYAYSESGELVIRFG